MPSDESKIWRYMDFVSFVSLLQTSQLFFSSPSRFEDPFEDVSPPAIAALYTEKEPSKQQVGGSEKLWKLAVALREQGQRAGDSRTHYFVNCWHMNEFESAAMWKLYTQAGGIAIQSTKGRLVKGFDTVGSTVSISPVTYFDYALDDLQSIPLPLEGGLPEQYNLMITPELCFKRKSFEHERELRVITWDSNDSATEAPGKYVLVDLDSLVERIYVSPISADWVADVVSREVKEHRLEKEIVHSTLYSKRLT